MLKNIDLRYNGLGDEGKGVIRDAVSGREGFKLRLVRERDVSVL